MFKIDAMTSEEIAYRVTRADGHTTVGPEYVRAFYQDTPGVTVEEVRGHTHEHGHGFVVERVVD